MIEVRLLGVAVGDSLVVLAVDGATLRVCGLEAIDGTPVLDLEPALACRTDRR